MSLLTSLKLASGLLCSLAVSSSLACRGPQMEDYVLLNSLPAAALSESVVAKVRLSKAQDRNATVEVIEPIKGVKEKQIIQIEVSNSSCSWLSARGRFSGGSTGQKISDQYFIAGQFKPGKKGELIFIGSWRDGKKIQ